MVSWDDNAAPINPYSAEQPIIVPPNIVLVLGDDRNNSIDSHVFGFVDQKLIIGRGWELFYPEQHYIHRPFWHRPLQQRNLGSESQN